MSRPLTLFTLACFSLLACTDAGAQALRTISTPGALGHYLHGVGNPPLRLSDDTIAIVSEGTTEGMGVLDDQILIVSGFESGLLSQTWVTLSSVLSAYGDLPRRLVRLDATSLLYVDQGNDAVTPSLLVVSGAGTTNQAAVHPLSPRERFSADFQKPAVLDAQSILWVGLGVDKLLGTADDRISFAFDLGTPGCQPGSVPAPSPMGGEVVAVSPTRGIARMLGADGMPGTNDDALLVIDRDRRSVRLGVIPVNSGIGVFSASGGPVLVGKDTVVYPSTGPAPTSLYTVLRDAAGAVPTVVFVGLPTELPVGWSLIPEPAGVSRDAFAWSNAGANRVFHDSDDQVRVCLLGTAVTVRTFFPGYGLGLSDTSIPPAHLGGGRVVFASNGSDGVDGSPDDGVVVAEALGLPNPVFTHLASGVQVLSLTGVNATTVAMQSLDSTFAFFQGIGTSEPAFSQFVEAVGCGACFVRINDWTIADSGPVSSDSTSLQDDLVTVQFPFVELYGTGQICASGHALAIEKDVAPLLGTTWPATLKSATTGMPAALLLSWYKADYPLNPVSRFHLDPANLFFSDVMIVDYAGEARVYLYFEPLPWLPGFSFCGQWGVYDPTGYAGVCVSSGFRVHF
jgi:hypothetical protein